MDIRMPGSILIEVDRSISLTYPPAAGDPVYRDLEPHGPTSYALEDIVRWSSWPIEVPETQPKREVLGDVHALIVQNGMLKHGLGLHDAEAIVTLGRERFRQAFGAYRKIFFPRAVAKRPDGELLMAYIGDTQFGFQLDWSLLIIPSRAPRAFAFFPNSGIQSNAGF